MKPTIVLLACISLLGACGGGSPDSAVIGNPVPTPGPSGSGGVNAADKQHLPYIVLVSFDGFRADYQDRFATTAMDRLAAAGVRAQSLVPVFPSVTFPNHYSIATGLYPSNHGIVANAFPARDRQRFYSLNDPASVGDGSWYGGEPVWVAAERSGLVTAAFFFVGTEAEIAGIRPTYWRQFDASIPGDNRVEQALDWLNMPADTRPHLITLYFEDTDSVGHQFGTDSAQLELAVGRVDRYLGLLLDGIDRLPFAQQVYVVLVSDHGMSNLPVQSNVLILSDFVDLTGITVIGTGSYAFLYFDQDDAQRETQIRDTINGVWSEGKAWLRDEAPASWNVTTGSRYPNVIVQADAQSTVVATPDRLAQLPAALHGWDPQVQDMHGIFLASGPRLPAGVSVARASVVDVYPLMLDILEIPLQAPIDGDPMALGGLLQ